MAHIGIGCLANLPRCIVFVTKKHLTSVNTFCNCQWVFWVSVCSCWLWCQHVACQHQKRFRAGWCQDFFDSWQDFRRHYIICFVCTQYALYCCWVMHVRVDFCFSESHMKALLGDSRTNIIKFIEWNHNFDSMNVSPFQGTPISVTYHLWKNRPMWDMVRPGLSHGCKAGVEDSIRYSIEFYHMM